VSADPPSLDVVRVAAELSGPDGPLAMADTARIIGGLRLVELVLFDALGHAAPLLAEPEQVVWASSASLRAAWRGSQLECLVPVSTGLAPAAGTPDPVGPATGSGLEALASLRTASEVPVHLPEMVAGWYEVLLAAYRYRLERLSAAADGPLERVFLRVACDLEAEADAERALRKLPGRGA